MGYLKIKLRVFDSKWNTLAIDSKIIRIKKSLVADTASATKELLVTMIKNYRINQEKKKKGEKNDNRNE